MGGVIVAGDTRGMLLCAAAAVLLGGFALRDVLAPVRLAADDQGLTMVTGLAHRERVSWPEVTHIRVARNARYGLRWELLEIETGETLHIFSSYELGTSCTEAAEELFRLRPARDTL
jgi:Bacterial PH domain